MFGVGVSHGQLENVLETALVNGLVEGRQSADGSLEWPGLAQMEGKVGVNCGGRSGRRRKALDLYGSLSFRESQLQPLKSP